MANPDERAPPVDKPRLCQNCTYWHVKSGDMGLCRAHAPTPDFAAQARYWPGTRFDDWCGEFTAA
jgi:hypothetical protein